MIGNILLIVASCIALGIFVGIPYVRGAMNVTTSSINKKRYYVVANLHKFEPKENSLSLDGKKIYLVSFKKIGL